MADRSLLLRDRIPLGAMNGVAVLYIAVAAHFNGSHYLLFPGLAALAYDALARPWGKWASQPGRLVVTPVAGAAIGILVTRALPFGVPAILLVVTSCLLLLALLKSAVAPGIAAGVLPVFLGITSWLYPASIALSLVVLLAILVPWQRHWRRTHPDPPIRTPSVDDVLESPAAGNAWILPFFAFLTVMALCAVVSGWRLILFPPLIVIAYEMFAHPTTCPWAGKPLALPGVCLLNAVAGWGAVSLFGSGAVAASCAMGFGIFALRLLRLRMPPALAVGLLPLVINAPSFKYPISVAIGAGALTLAYQFHQRWITGRGPAGRNAPNAMRSG
ncbi:hypothetical protein A5692_24050 [Mycobacterium sp. E342]|uniref:hypothetical protein n=1 Tax=Mycobacterium sp. E342 TaxID=1834147 RepID=UPI0007FC5F12|nr:hypothetical protein [Mycobacterium sp. E342]OBH27665.1 hypothetical protein A5692_24050 [Mycobacterium sp. E342]